MTEIKLTSDITVRLIQKVGGDHMVVAAARVSTSGQEAEELAWVTCPLHSKYDPEYTICELCAPYREKEKEHAGLINYLMKHRHGTPFEHGSLTFFVHAPIFVWREWHRHRVMSYNEESGRYKQLDPVFYVPPRDRPMFKVDGWKPGRPKFTVLDTTKFEDLKYYKLCDNLAKVYRLAYSKYEENLGLGIDPGLARDCLPVGIYSSCWVTCNPRSLMAFLSLRTHEPTAKAVSYPLYEIEVAARQVEALFAEGWPLTYRAFCDNGRVAP